jgi:hypothetical protein
VGSVPRVIPRSRAAPRRTIAPERYRCRDAIPVDRISGPSLRRVTRGRSRCGFVVTRRSRRSAEPARRCRRRRTHPPVVPALTTREVDRVPAHTEELGGLYDREQPGNRRGRHEHHSFRSSARGSRIVRRRPLALWGETRLGTGATGRGTPRVPVRSAAPHGRDDGPGGRREPRAGGVPARPREHQDGRAALRQPAGRGGQGDRGGT